MKHEDVLNELFHCFYEHLLAKNFDECVYIEDKKLIVKDHVIFRLDDIEGFLDEFMNDGE